MTTLTSHALHKHGMHRCVCCQRIHPLDSAHVRTGKNNWISSYCRACEASRNNVYFWDKRRTYFAAKLRQIGAWNGE